MAVFISALYQAFGRQLCLARPRAVIDTRAWHMGRYENSYVVTSTPVKCKYLVITNSRYRESQRKYNIILYVAVYFMGQTVSCLCILIRGPIHECPSNVQCRKPFAIIAAAIRFIHKESRKFFGRSARTIIFATSHICGVYTPCLKKNCANLSFALFLSNINRFQKNCTDCSGINP